MNEEDLKYQIERAFRVRRIPMTPKDVHQFLTLQGFDLFAYKVGYAIDDMRILKRVGYATDHRYDYYYLEESTQQKLINNLREHKKKKTIRLRQRAVMKIQSLPRKKVQKPVEMLPEIKISLKNKPQPLPQLYIDSRAKINTYSDDRLRQWMKEGKSREFLKRVS